MRFSVLLAALATSLGPSLRSRIRFAPTVKAISIACRFVGEISKADESIAACDRVINDPKATAKNRAAAFSSRCGWWWAKQDLDRALSDCNEALRADSSNAAAYLNRGNAYLNKSDFEHAFADFNAGDPARSEKRLGLCRRGNLYKNKGDLDHALADLNEAIRLDPDLCPGLLRPRRPVQKHG